MVNLSQGFSLPDRLDIVQPCNEGCRHYRRLRDHGWSPYGYCNNPFSAFHANPVRGGRDCRHYQPGDGGNEDPPITGEQTAGH